MDCVLDFVYKPLSLYLLYHSKHLGLIEREAEHGKNWPFDVESVCLNYQCN